MKIGDVEYKVVVISLSDSKRRDSLKERLAVGGITEYEIVDARQVLDTNLSTIESLTGSSWKRDARLKNERKNDARMACYLSHILLVLGANTQPLIVLEDDIVFKKRLDSIGFLPEGCSVGFLDGTKIEMMNDYQFGEEYSCGWKKIDIEKFRVWCLGCYIVPDPQAVYHKLIGEHPRVVDKLFIDCFQKEGTGFVYLPILSRQDRTNFQSTIA